jgi:hypothetical protein
MKDGDLIIKYKEKQSINTKLDRKIENFLKTLGFKWIGSGISVQDNVRDIQFKKITKYKLR